MWPKGLRNLMMGPLRGPDDDDQGGGGDDKNKPVDNGKIKIGNKEYDPKFLETAISLREALEDENTGTEIIRTLADRAGLLKKDIAPKAGETKTETESRVAKKLKAKLGKDYDKFSDAVGPALQEAFEEMLAEHKTTVSTNSTQEKWESAVDTFNDRFETNPDIEEAMKELIEDAPPNLSRKGFDAQKYLARIYKQACDDLDEEPKEKSSRSSKKSTSSRGRSRNDDDGPADIVVRDIPKGKTIDLDDALEAAMKGIRLRRS